MNPEEFFYKHFNTPEKRSKLIRYFWVVSLFMMLLGFFFMFIFWNRGI